ncbi:MAG: hypothetical protein WD342_04770 [Verrucomicrobiales bacterium]
MSCWYPRLEETRQAFDTIMDRVERWHRAGLTKEVLTVDQPADGPYLLDRLERRDSGRADAARELLEWNGGGNHGSGVGLANIDTQGNIQQQSRKRSSTAPRPAPPSLVHGAKFLTTFTLRLGDC